MFQTKRILQKSLIQNLKFSKQSIELIEIKELQKNPLQNLLFLNSTPTKITSKLGLEDFGFQKGTTHG